VQNEYSYPPSTPESLTAKAVIRSNDLFWMFRSFSEYPSYTFVPGISITRLHIEDEFRNICNSLREHRELYEATHRCEDSTRLNISKLKFCAM